MKCSKTVCALAFFSLCAHTGSSRPCAAFVTTHHNTHIHTLKTIFCNPPSFSFSIMLRLPSLAAVAQRRVVLPLLQRQLATASPSSLRPVKKLQQLQQQQQQQQQQQRQYQRRFAATARTDEEKKNFTVIFKLHSHVGSLQDALSVFRVSC